ncbi:cytochrome P450 [Cucurbitaria berberidis CBS 394.84]|uniref:Cytochrome P450 n=1 Tax=Cucurbitaria berberidis CBS 394.84 TaxID=1168544 RepID=A0A9P4GDT2_9PLEO|nr:cytochrome P450 [Cucurbitaria berberidis CBS 394.84]KAF1844083.1 cytochrome P450 [Cucurbitaria berberidis CBS 394.84]
MTQLIRRVELAHNKPIIILLALLTHHALHTGEWDNRFHIFLGIWTLAFSGIAASEYMSDERVKTVGAVIQVTATTAVIYFATLAASILLHRGFFHRLRKIPGPFLARFSKLYGIFAGVLPDFQYFKWCEKMKEEYKTDVIRTGPREVTVYCADAIPLIHGPMSRCRKGPWYSGYTHVGGDSAHTTRDKEEHKRRRKAWDHAFNAKALREYEPRLNRHAVALMEQLKEQAKQPSVCFTNWANYYSFDVMGDVGFSRSFGMVEKGEEADVIKLLHESMSPLSVFGHVNWGLNLLTRTSVGAKALLEHIDWTSNVLKERKLVTPKENDVFSRLLDPNDDKITPEMNADSRLLVVAGSDTTAATLAWIAYELCKNLEVQAKLRKAIDAIEPEKWHLDVDDVANIAFLDGVINEVLRLHPAVPSGVQRETPPEGLTLPNGTFLPGNVHIWMPIHSIQRDPRYFQKPLDFMPERWTGEQPDAVIEKRAFMPFNTGVYNCVGQKLAMMELRSVTANLIRLFEMSFAEGEDGSTIEKKTRDCFTTNVGKLDVKLTPRYKA